MFKNTTDLFECLWLFLVCFPSLFPSPVLSIPANPSAVWDPSASPDPSAVLPAEMAVEQVQLMARIVLALLAQPFGENKVPKGVKFNM